jgi:periplasmic copper chaperone A
MRKLDKPVEQFGEQVTEEVGQVTFTADGEAAAIHPGEFRDFGLSVGVPEGRPGSKLTFKALQTYTGEGAHVRRWIGPPDSESPAPQVELTAAEGEEASAPAAQEPAAAPASEEDDDGNGLAIAALIVGAAGLAAGVAALLLGRRRTRVGTA